jgi:hypothetical protein
MNRVILGDATGAMVEHVVMAVAPPAQLLQAL